MSAACGQTGIENLPAGRIASSGSVAWSLIRAIHVVVDPVNYLKRREIRCNVLESGIAENFPSGRPVVNLSGIPTLLNAKGK